MLVPVYDIVNCGPRHRFSANGKIVHNCDFLNVQNLPNKRVSRMREAFRAPSGQHIVVVDSSQIELRMNMWFCGQHDKLELLRSGGDIYKAEAASQFNIDETDVNSQQRQYGKIIQLGCIAEDTLVVASSDRINAVLVPIQNITTDHWVWDGVEWVSHLGSIFSGEKECYSKAGFIMTPDHKVLCEETWVPFQSLVQNDGMYRLALETGSENLQSLGFSSELVEEWSIFSSIVRVVSKITEFTTTIYERVSLLDVMCVLRSNLGTTKRTIVGMLTSCQTMPNGLDCSIEYPRLLTDAVTQMTPGTRIMAEEVSVCARSGGRIGENFLRILLRYLDGMTQACSWIGRIMRRGIFRGIFGLLRGARICRTDEPSQFLLRRTKTYDIAFAGPRRRFTIWSAGSALQVHNCGYRMGAKVFRQFCAAGPLGCDPIYLSDEEAWRNIYTYRQGNANVAAMWKTLDKAIYSMAMAHNEFTLPEVPILTFGPGYIVLPSGRRLKYPNLSHTEAGWVFEIPSLGKKRNYRFLHGGTLLENIIQAMARDVVFYQELEIAKKYRTVATTHDEVLFLAPIEEAEEALAFAIDVFSVTPEWAPGLPLSAEGAHAPHYCK